MKTIESKLLREWSQICRYPTLLTEVANKEQVSSAKAARALLRDIAAAHTPAKAFDELLKVEEFNASALLLAKLEVDKAVSNTELSEMSDRLGEARSRAHAKIEGRKFVLATRALGAGLEGVPPEGLSVVDSRSASADDLLDLWESEICSKEALIQQILRARLNHARENADQHDPSYEVWEKSLSLCIERCRFKAAERLLDLGPAAVTGKVTDPIEIPRRPVWPYTASARDVLKMLSPLANAENEIRREWGPAHDDQIGLRLLKSLEALVDSGREAMREDVEEFVSSIDAFLGAPPREHRVIPWYNDSNSVIGFSSVLYGLIEPRVPRLGTCIDGVPFWLPRDPGAKVPEQLHDTPALVGFHPDRELTGGVKMLTFSSTLLYRLVGDTHRRVNFIRWLARQIKTEDMLPLTLDLRLLPNDEEGIRRYVAWLFDYHGVTLTSDSVLDLIVFYSASSPYLLRALLGEIGAQIEDPVEGVTIKHVQSAWENNKFRDAATVHCISPVVADPWPLAVLACIYLWTEPEEEVTAISVSEWLSAFDYSGGKDVAGALRELVGCNLLVEGQAPDSVRIPRSARTLLMREHLGNLEQYLQKHLGQLNERLA